MRAAAVLALLGSCGGNGGTAEPAADEALCPVTFRYTPAGEPDAVYVTGDFDGWRARDHALAPQADGSWAATLELPPGAWPYKFVEVVEWSQDRGETWVCDPGADLVHCPEDTEASTEWSHECSEPGANTACNSMVLVPDCTRPRIEVMSVSVDRAAGDVEVVAAAVPSVAGGALSGEALLDGEPVDGAFDGTLFRVSADALAPGRHRVVLRLSEEGAGEAEEAVVPFWTDAEDPEEAWRRGVLYLAFLDRLWNGNPSNDGEEAGGGAMDYAGGDLAGLRAMLPYLADLGVTAVWITSPLENAEGGWPGQCGEEAAGYHGYWPDDPEAVEAHLGDEAELAALVADAHDLGIRVVADVVLNHVHEDHPYYRDHPDWFHAYLPCKVGDDASNFDEYPERCWFAEYLPDVDYTEPDALARMVEDAVARAREWDLDGLRVDAVKHMNHAVAWNLAARAEDALEHRAVGGDEVFWLVGETFDGRERIAAYLEGRHAHGLDGQFDFPLYYAIDAALARETAAVSSLADALAASEAAYGDALTSSFLGNHDVARFATRAAGEDLDWCDADGPAADSADPRALDRLRLAFTFLLTAPGVPLVYYGDEIGMPGHGDPDDRQPWWAHASLGGTVEEVAASLDEAHAAVLRHVAALARARRAHPALWKGERVEWWREDPGLAAWALSADGDHALVVINRTSEERTLVNGLAPAGLPAGGAWEDVLTGETVQADGDSLAVTVGAYESRVFVAR